jgi:hypothetical protein
MNELNSIAFVFSPRWAGQIAALSVRNQVPSHGLRCLDPFCDGGDFNITNLNDTWKTH